jgi:predicted restriction endonuclease
MVTGCKVLDILEAAHINPFKGEKDNHLANGLLLRSDIHTLFDLDLIGIHPETLEVHLHKRINQDGYQIFNRKIVKGINKNNMPNKKALMLKWEKFNNR